MSSDNFLLEILVCPETHQTLTPANSEQLGRFSEAIQKGKLTDRGGDKVEGEVDGLLIRKDGLIGFPIRDGIPEMLLERAIEIEDLL
ncbi:MAG: hypothetical protein CMH54_12835 [Myxococcales bacterium]|nr:hypothetical protein [Myxococcales bacterium]|tara:strand:- start:563 stop:823 length:261 start_codon:yes stop_codon:yes gene_type:complete